MESLYRRNCKNYKKEESSIEESIKYQLISEIPFWEITLYKQVEILIREFQFPGFQEAFNFTSQIASLAEEQNHHPKIIIEWGKATVHWWSHEIQGLHINDFIMAAKSDFVFKSFSK